eukprot:CAMPEP_0174889112 /NCGR_PEP_ID=MMETSP0167-20121228/4375_1 /TAXON_ID=38298 /ORGANISM="Rhodella maculata, Strain CCMP736" /LENGTH=32 /DNA_ID= /DNA_START= /DNA_END= /DNA_ORIENTATION=
MSESDTPTNRAAPYRACGLPGMDPPLRDAGAL